MFHQAENTLFYLLQDLAFVPIQVMIVTLIINRFLNVIEMRKKIKKINVIISSFFVESGTAILRALSEFDRNRIDSDMINMEELNSMKVNQMKRLVMDYEYDVYADPEKLKGLSERMNENRAFMLNMLENSNLLEHDSFTDMLWAVFHVGDELRSRGNFKNLDEGDIAHLSNDLKRAYSAMIIEWINYMGYLQKEYPFLYVLAIRKNPFVPESEELE